MLGRIMSKKLRSIDIELAVSNYFNPRQNLVVPNVSWGMFGHECDLLILTKAGYAWEVEIKVTKSDLIKDKQKPHGHNDRKIKHLYFAIPDYLEPHIEHIPERAGILTIYTGDNQRKPKCRTFRKPRANQNSYKFTDKDKYQIARLGALRIWGLKRNIVRLSNEQN